MLLALTETKIGGAESGNGPLASTKKHARKKVAPRQKETDLVLAVGDTNAGDRDDWILDNGASRHLVSDSKLLVDSKLCSDEIAMADGELLRITRCGGVRLQVLAGGVEKIVLHGSLPVSMSGGEHRVIRQVGAEMFCARL